VADLVYIAVIVVFFASCWTLIGLCEKLGG
jgi:hypothetical protein